MDQENKREGRNTDERTNNTRPKRKALRNERKERRPRRRDNDNNNSAPFSVLLPNVASIHRLQYLGGGSPFRSEGAAYQVSFTILESPCHQKLFVNRSDPRGWVQVMARGDELLQCEWWIQAPHGSHIRLTVEELILPTDEHSYLAVNEAGDPSYPRDTTRVYQEQGRGGEGEGGFWTGRGRGTVGHGESWTRHGRSSIIVERRSTGHGSNSARHKKGWSERGKGRAGYGRDSEGRKNKPEGHGNQSSGNGKGTTWRILQAPTPMIVSLDHNLSLVLQGQGPNASIVFKYELYDCGDDNPECPYWTADGECNVNPGWMKPHCRKSCFTCDYSIRCEDEHGDCQFWADHDQCGENQRWMAVHCRRACGYCGGCQDASGGCQRWAGRGECHRNPRYMARFCPRACRFCESQDSTSSNTTTQHTANTTRQITTTTIVHSRDLPTANPPPRTTTTTTTSPRQDFPAIHTHRKSPSGRRNAMGRNDEENETTRGIKTDFHLKPRKFKPNSVRPWPSKRTRNHQHNGRVHVRQENTRVSTRVPKNNTNVNRTRVPTKKPTFPMSSNSNQSRNSVYGEGEHDMNTSNTTTTSSNSHIDLQHPIANNFYQIAFSKVDPFLRSTTTDLGNEQKSNIPERVDTHSPSQTPRPMETNITTISSHVNNDISIPQKSYRARDTTNSRPEMIEEEERTSLKSEYNTHGLNNKKQMLSFEDCEDGGNNAERCVAGFNWTSSTKDTQDFIKGLIRNQHHEDSNPQVTDENDVAITTNAGELSRNRNALNPSEVKRRRNHSHEHRNRNHRPNNRVQSQNQRSRKQERVNYIRKRGRWRTRKPNNEHDNAQAETGNIRLTQGSRMVDRPTENTQGRSGRRQKWRGEERRKGRRRGTQDTRRREEQERKRERRMRQRDRRQGRQRKSSSTRRNENQDSRRFEIRIGDFPIRVSPTTTIPVPSPRTSMTTPTFPTFITHSPPTTPSHAPLAPTHTPPTTPHLAGPGPESSSTIATTISTLIDDGRRPTQERRRNHKDVIREGNVGNDKHGVTERRPPTNAINRQTNHHFSNFNSVNSFLTTPSKRKRPRKQDDVSQRGARQRNHQRKQKRRRGRKNRKSHSRDQRRRNKQHFVTPSQRLEESEIRQRADSSRFLPNQPERKVAQKTQIIDNWRENSDNQHRLNMDRSSSKSTLQYPDLPPVHYGPPAHHHLNLTSIAETQMEDSTRKTNHRHHIAEEDQSHPEQLNRDRKLQHNNGHHIAEDNNFNQRHPEQLRKDSTNRHNFGQDSASKTNLGQYVTEENQLNQRHPAQNKIDRNTLHSFNQESEFPLDEKSSRDQVTSPPEVYAEWGIGPRKPSHQSYRRVRPWWRYRRGFYRRGKDVYEDVRARLHD